MRQDVFGNEEAARNVIERARESMAIEVMADIQGGGIKKIKVLRKRKLPLKMGAVIEYWPAIEAIGRRERWGDKSFGWVHGMRDTGNGILYKIGANP